MHESRPDIPPPPDAAWLFRVLMENIPDAVYFKDRGSRFLAVSRALCEKFGLEGSSQVIGKTDLDFFSPEHARQAFDDEQEIVRTGRPIVGKEEKETWGDRPDTWASSTKMPLAGPGGEIIGTFGISRDITQRKLFQERLAESEAQLRQHIDRMQKDLRRAQAVQKALLPAGPPELDRFLVDFRYRPMESVGGDHLAFFPQAGGGLGVFIADVAGHGVSAALFVTLLKFISERLAAGLGDDPAGFVEMLNADLLHEMPSTFATALYGCFRPEAAAGRATFSLASAGHPPPLLLKAAGGTVSRMDIPPGGVLGIGRSFKASRVDVPLERGDRILVYSDGFSEGRDVCGRPIALEALLDLVRAARRGTLGETLDAALDAVRAWRGGADPTDDIALCGIEVR
jgi:sigma-B regulation protein RsbU (phosphoserine phosphatase)